MKESVDTCGMSIESLEFYEVMYQIITWKRVSRVQSFYKMFLIEIKYKGFVVSFIYSISLVSSALFDKRKLFSVRYIPARIKLLPFSGNDKIHLHRTSSVLTFILIVWRLYINYRCCLSQTNSVVKLAKQFLWLVFSSAKGQSYER